MKMMKYQLGQTVILLDLEYKQAGTAVIRKYNEWSNQYVVDYIYPNGQKADQITIPEERLILAPDALKVA
jgi:hypothetical protein